MLQQNVMHRCDAQPQIPMVGQNRRTLKRDVDHHDDPLPKDDAVQRAFSQTFGSNCSRQSRTFHTSMHPAVDPSSGACCCSETDVAITHVDFLSTWQATFDIENIRPSRYQQVAPGKRTCAQHSSAALCLRCPQAYPPEIISFAPYPSPRIF